MANIGFRPTFKEESEPLLEVHFFDFDSDIYGRRISVSFIKFFRNEEKFDSVVALRAQLHWDKHNCNKLINEHKRF